MRVKEHRTGGISNRLGDGGDRELLQERFGSEAIVQQLERFRKRSLHFIFVNFGHLFEGATRARAHFFFHRRGSYAIGEVSPR